MTDSVDQDRQMDCQSCGRRHGAGELLCVTCGEPLRAGARPARRRAPPAPTTRERRPMTALFCDLVDSVGLSVRLDPEDLMRVFDLYRAVCEAVIAKHGGYLAQYMGDGVLAYFGYPRADEDDAANAVRAGMEILDRLRSLESGLDSPLEARAGIATGLVVVTQSEGRGGAPGVVGKMPNLAARLQSLATPGAVVISAATRRVTRGQFTYRDLGAVPLKGFSRPVPAWEVAADSASESRFRAHVQEMESPFVGRRDELAALWGAWTAAKSGRGRVRLVTGEPGIGKSRLTEAFEGRMAEERHERLLWCCSPRHADRPLHPVIVQIERSAAIDRGDLPPDRLAKLVAWLGPSGDATLAALAFLLSIPLGRPSPLDAVTSEKRKDILNEALLAMVARLEDAAPLLIVVEDLQWIDATSLDLLTLLARGAGERPRLILATARPEFKPRWTDLPFMEILHLERLDSVSAGRLCAHVAGNALPPDILGQILARGEGNPLFVEELTRTVVEAMAGVRDETSDSPVDGAVAIPQTLHDSLIARLDRLGPARSIANVGAVIGRNFDYGLLAEVAGRPAAELRAALRRLKQAGLIVQTGSTPTGAYGFRHALIRDAAYDSLLRADRQTLHGRIASVIRAKFPDLVDSDPELLAFHLREAGAGIEAIDYWEIAGARAAARGAPVEAVGHYSAALEVVREQADRTAWARRELSLLIPFARGLASWRGFAVDEVREALQRAHELCDSLGDTSDTFPVLNGLTAFHIVRSELAAAQALARRSLEIGERTASPPHLIEANHALGWVYLARGDYQRARLYLERGLRLYADNEAAGLQFLATVDPRVSCLVLLSIIRRLQDDHHGADKATDEALAWARSLGRPHELAVALTYASSSASAAGDFARGERIAAESIAISEAHGFVDQAINARLNLAMAIGWMGRVREAVEIIEPALEAQRANGHRLMVAFFIGQLASFQAILGHLDEAHATIDAAIAQAVACDDLYYLSGLHRMRAEIMMREPRPDLDLAESELRLAVSIAQSQGAAGLEALARARLKRLARRREAVQEDAGVSPPGGPLAGAASRPAS